MIQIADHIRGVLIPFLIGAAVVLVLLLAALLIGRGVDELRFRRRQRLIAECQPLVDALFLANPPIAVMQQLIAHGTRHQAVVAGLLVAPARFATGRVIDQLRRTASLLGFIDRWTHDLRDRRWWIRAEAARALGQLQEGTVVNALLATLDDDHEEVRAAGVEALGNIADPTTVATLVSKLPDQSRHQRVRLIEALHRFGHVAVAPLLQYERAHPHDRAMIAELLDALADPSAIDSLVQWTGDDRSEVRVASMRAIGSIGLDSRTYYYALRALSSDAEPEVRAMAARALGRGGRREAAEYLAAHLQDDWIVAAHCATALRALGTVGLSTLQAHAGDPGAAGDLARQILFDLGVDSPPETAVAV